MYNVYAKQQHYQTQNFVYMTHNTNLSCCRWTVWCCKLFEQNL